VQIIPLNELIRESEIKPDIKTIADTASPIKDSIYAARLLNEFGINPDKVVIKQYAGKQYVIFNGNPNTRNTLKGTRYLTTNLKVVRMAVGPKGIKDSIKSGFVLTVVLSVGIKIFNYFIRDTATLSQLLGTITSDILTIGISSIAAAVVGLAVGSTVVLGSIAAAPLIAAIAVGVITGFVLGKIDEKIGATRALINAYEIIGLNLKDMEYEANWWFNYFEKNPIAIMRLFGARGISTYGGY